LIDKKIFLDSVEKGISEAAGGRTYQLRAIREALRKKG
jgi:hypothetical protein